MAPLRCQDKRKRSLTGDSLCDSSAAREGLAVGPHEVQRWRCPPGTQRWTLDSGPASAGHFAVFTIWIPACCFPLKKARPAMWPWVHSPG